MPESVIQTTIDRSQHVVLVVDDNPTTRYSTARFVRAAGFLTEEAATGAEAVAKSVRRVSAVVLDVHLPDMSGFEVCRLIRSDERTSLLPIIHLSATYVENEDKVAGLNAGADAYLVHPVEPAVLTATLQALIRARLAEDSFRRSDIRFRAVFSQALSGMALFQANGAFADVNPAMARMLGRSREELLGRPISDFAPSEWTDFVSHRTITALEEGASWHGEFPLMRPDGAWVYLQWSISAHLEPGLRIGIAVDVSERQELDRRRQEVLEREQAARTTAERHSRTKDDFVAVLSHELRTPLNSISGWVHILKKRGTTPEMLKGLEAIDRNVHAQARIISDILDVSRINSGKLRLDRQWTDPAEVVNTAIDALRDSISAKQLTLDIQSPGDSRSAWLDPTRFQQIVWNLMTNAIKFSREGGAIEVVLAREGDVLKLSVRDFGRGIRPDFIEHLFDRFTQSDSPDSRFHGGLGLGLSIVKHLAELHGGGVVAASEGEDKGALFEVELHVAQTDTEAAPGAVHDADEIPSTHSSPLKDMEVLVVEDSTDASEMLHVVLADAGAHVRLAIDYDSALQAAAQSWPDVLVSDIGLPGRDGYELIRELRSAAHATMGRRLLAVALTAFSRNQDRERALAAGFDVHLGKPLQPHRLIAAIVELAGRTPGDAGDGSLA
ncbi:response regulator [Variovorax sp. J2P1-59]|uniref:hybrid sensor histidine kinase/response regulator n=1 Tax=Variovorax flavidus TaxID=3053501 RepID=UPI002577BF4B|nr:response regulator [Variovorax sp. J2P1-59]MDM0074510.1 response regulator [Variovorax sp. J2P1-59]